VLRSLVTADDPHWRWNVVQDGAARRGWLAIARRLREVPLAFQGVVVLALIGIVGWLGGATPLSEANAVVLLLPVSLLCSIVFSRWVGLIALIVGAVVVIVIVTESAKTPDSNFMFGLVVCLLIGIFGVAAGGALYDASLRLAAADEQIMAARQRVAAAECEKDLLLHELTHRFRNDLANLTSLLRLQADASDDSHVRDALRSVSNRVLAMGRVNQRLSNVSKTSNIELCPFVVELCNDLRSTLIGPRPIRVSVGCGELRIPVSQAVTVGLIVNELLTNAVKYAFPNDRVGTIDVRVSRCAGKDVSVIVADDGVGVNTEARTGTGLGQRLIDAMARQLGGTFRAEIRKDGRTCILEFPIQA
jgi:two-component system, sensor histidine kinase PdtaS